MEYNLKEREVYCARCHKYVLTDNLAPRCEVCGSGMITVISSQIDGSRLTGEPLKFPSFQLLDNKKK